MFHIERMWSGSLVALIERFRLDGAVVPRSLPEFRAVLLNVQKELSGRGIQIRLDSENVEIWRSRGCDEASSRCLRTGMPSVSAAR